jgi:hypothetical protein
LFTSRLTIQPYEILKRRERMRNSGLSPWEAMTAKGGPMSHKRLFVLVATIAGLALTGSAIVTAPAADARATGNHTFVFSGRLLADPAPGSAAIVVHVEKGDRPALRALVGQSQNQAFAVDSHTVFTRWSQGRPTVVTVADLEADDWVTVRVRAAHNSSLAQIVATPAAAVADRGPDPRFPRRPLWRFVGTLLAPPSGGHISLHITSGNWKALQAMLGQPLDQTFTYDSKTIFLRWTGRVPAVIAASQLKVGEATTIRIRAPRASTLAQVEATPAARVVDREPPPPPQE